MRLHGCPPRWRVRHIVTASPGSSQPGESVRRPVLAADAVVHEEEAVGIVAALRRQQSLVVPAPERALPVALEEVGLGHVGPAPGATASSDSIARSTASASLRATSRSGSWPGMPGSAGSRSAATMASAKASSTAGFVAVSRARAMSSAGAPASPLLKCRANAHCRLAATRASTSAPRASSASSAAGSQAERYASRNCPACPPSPAQ